MKEVSKKSKDIMHICKGWYNQELYPDALEALKAYQHRKTMCPKQYIKDEDIYVWLLDAAKEIFDLNDWFLILKSRIPEDIRLHKLIPEHYNNPELSIKYLCWLIIRVIQGINVRNEYGWIIDMSEYDNIEEYYRKHRAF